MRCRNDNVKSKTDRHIVGESLRHTTIIDTGVPVNVPSPSEMVRW